MASFFLRVLLVVLLVPEQQVWGLEGELTLRQHAIAGAFARSIAQTAVHPLNVAKTLYQTQDGGKMIRSALASPALARITFTRGLLAQALLSLPNGAINFWALEGSRRLARVACPLSNPVALDLISASIGTAIGTLVSLPQSVLNDRIMSGGYRNLKHAAREIGLRGLYPPSTWRAALLSKVPSYALNWAAYQHLRRAYLDHKSSDAVPNPSTTAFEDVVIGALASSFSVCVMIPFDTIKVRMTTNNGAGLAYLGVSDAVRRMLREEGAIAFYKGLLPRLASVAPMTAIQFAVYEQGKRHIPAIQANLEAHRLSLSHAFTQHKLDFFSGGAKQQQEATAAR